METEAIQTPEETKQADNARPTAYVVNDDKNLEEKDLKRTYLFGSSEDKNPDQPGYEGEGMGGHAFNKDNVNPSGDDKANPSQNACYANAYFRRTEPSDEQTENGNFKDPAQSGRPDYTQAQPTANGADGSSIKNEKPDEGQHENSDPGKNQQGDSGNGGEVNIPGPGELPDQQKVGESGNTSAPGEADYKPENGEGKPDYGSHSPENHIET